MIKVTHYRNSFISYHFDDKIVWCDPWIGPANHNNWLSASVDEMDFLEETHTPDFIYISHLHDDHFDINFIEKIFSIASPKIIIGAQYKSHSLIAQRILDNKICSSNSIIYLDFYKKYSFGQFEVILFPDGQFMQRNSIAIYPIDSSILFLCNEMQFYNQTDNILSYDKILNLKDIVKDKLQLDFAPILSFLPYCAASCYPQSFFGLSRKEKRVKLIQTLFHERFLKCCEAINSGYYVPSGGTYTLKYKSLDEFKAVPSNNELNKMISDQKKVEKFRILNDSMEFMLQDNLVYTKKDLKSGAYISNENKINVDQGVVQSYSSMLNQVLISESDKLNKLDCTLEFHLFTGIQPSPLEQDSTIKSSDYKTILLASANQSKKNCLSIFLSPDLLDNLIKKGLSWNACNFSAYFERIPDIYDPNTDIFLNLFFRRCYISWNNK